MEPRRSPDRARAERAAREKERREAMYRAELEERAALLQRLGQNKQQVRQRLAANLDWDFPGGASPVSPAALDAIVDRVFGQNPTGRTVPRSKGGTR
jgi:hypothetical protein